MMTRLLLILLLSGLCPLLHAQSPEELETRISKIKGDASYINGADFRSDERKGRRNAFNEYCDQINNRRTQEGKPMLSPRQLMEFANEITYLEDGLYRVCFYAKIDELLAAIPGSHPATPRDIVRTAPGTPPDILPGQEEQQTLPQVPPQAPPQTPPQQQPRPRPEQHPQDQPGQQQLLPGGRTNGDDIARMLCQIEMADEMALQLRSLKSKGYVTAFNYARSTADITDKMYLICIEGEGRVVAIISPREAAARINFLTNLPDHESNYYGNHHILWFTTR